MPVTDKAMTRGGSDFSLKIHLSITHRIIKQEDRKSPNRTI